MILHADLDAFYAAVAQRDDASLRGKPIVVAGSSRRAVVLTASYEARPFGIRSAMPLYRAKQLCADLIIVPPQYDAYRDISREVFALFRKHARAVEGLSFDEAFLELGNLSMDDARGAARSLKSDVVGATSLTVSVGIASGKMVAKIASDDGKPDGLVAVPEGTEAAYLADKPVSRLWGIGPKTAQRLQARGIERIGQIAGLDDQHLFELFGRWGKDVRDLARGIDPRPVVEDEDWRSVSSEETFEHDVRDPAALAQTVREQAAELAARLVRKELRAYTIGVKIKLADFSIHGKQTTLAEPTNDARIIAAAASFCLKRANIGEKPVRLIGVRASSLVRHAVSQISLFGAPQAP